MADDRDYRQAFYNLRNRNDRLKRELEAERNSKLEMAQQFDQHKQATKRLWNDHQALLAEPRLTPEEMQDYDQIKAQMVWDEHVDKFEGAFNDVLAPGVSVSSVLMACGYDPRRVTDLSPEVFQVVFDHASELYPQFFVNGGFEEEGISEDSESIPEIGSNTDSVQRAFEVGAQLQNSQQPAFQTGQGTDSNVRYDMPQSPASGYGNQGSQVTTPNAEFRGFGAASGRGGPSPTKVPSVGAHLRDPVWLSQNQGALAQAISEGVQVVNLDK